jgi:F1F0 ATPase subunit 2
MSESTQILIPFMMGMALGAIYFTGLWYTVRKLFDARRPLAYLLRSFLARAFAIVIGFHVVMSGGWDRLVVALIGFILMREILVRRMGRNTS